MSDVLAQVLLRLIQLLMFAIFAQVILSWLLVAGIRSPFILTLARAVSSITEPLLRPLRRVIPNIGMIDITPMVAIIILAILQRVLSAVL